MSDLLLPQTRKRKRAAYRSNGLIRVALVLVSTTFAARLLHAQLDTVPTPRPHIIMALGQIVAINALVNRVDAWGRNQEWARVGTRSWSRNIRLGWAWDEDQFSTNVFAHPYHGAAYFNTARANGVDFFESIPITLFGVWTWEYFGETERPSLNDFFLSSFGGIELGEIFHRAGATIRDNTEHGTRRTLRELAALPFDPMGGLNRLVRGDWKTVGPNPDAHDPDAYVLRLGGGTRFAKEGTGVFVGDVAYGDQFAGEYKMPFDVFNLRIMISRGGLMALQTAGRLYARPLNDTTARFRHVFTVNQRYNYESNPARNAGDQSVEVGIASRWRLSDKREGGYAIRTGFYLSGMILGAIDAPGSGVGLRDYDFGSGGGFRWETALERHGERFLLLHGRVDYMHTVSGAAADHIVTVSGLELAIPVTHRLGIAAQSYLFDRSSHYSDRRANKRDYPEGRLMIVWTRAASRP